MYESTRCTYGTVHCVLYTTVPALYCMYMTLSTAATVPPCTYSTTVGMAMAQPSLLLRTN